MFYQSQAAGVNHSVNHNRSVQSAIEDLKIDGPSENDETKENLLVASQIPQIASQEAT